jgi:hypothetical protein
MFTKGNSQIPVFDTLSELVNAPMKEGQNLILAGNVALGDGHSGLYRVVAAPQTAAFLEVILLVNGNYAVLESDESERSFDTIALLTAATYVREGQLYSTKGYTTAGDGGAPGKGYLVKTTTQAAADGDTIDEVGEGFTLGVAGLVAVLQPVNGTVTLAQFGATTAAADNTAAWDAAITYIKKIKGRLVVNEIYPFTQTAHFPSGFYTVDMREGQILSSSTVVNGATIGDTGSEVFNGNILGLYVEKAAINAGLTDYGIVYINCVEAFIPSPHQRKFDYGHAFMPTGGSRVAYCDIQNALSFDHIFGVYTFPSDTSFVTENTFTAGRFHSTVAARLNSHIYLSDNTAGKNAVEHNRFYGVSIEGYSGGGTSGNRAVWCEHASHNVFDICRTEEYNTGWAVEAYHFENGSEYNIVRDPRFDARIQDNATGDGQIVQSPVEGERFALKFGAGDKPASDIHRYEAVTNSYAQKITDEYPTSGNIKIQHLESKVAIAAPRTHDAIKWSTAFGDIFVCDDAGTLKPRDNFADCGSASNRWREVFAINSTINTSDRTEKTDFTEISDSLKAAGLAVKNNIQLWRWISSVEDKGNEARWHFGPIAQDVHQIFQDHGIDAFEYGFMCRDDLVEVTRDEEGIITGTKIIGERWGLRPTEIMWLIIAAL